MVRRFRTAFAAIAALALPAALLSPLSAGASSAAHFSVGHPRAAPELTGISTWINSNPVTLASLRGKVVLVDFWTFGCVNCQRTLPYVKAWYAKYHGRGFEIIGVHTPELSYERSVANVRKAVNRLGIAYPVAIDPSFATWNAYSNQYWPAEYFIDKQGRIRHYVEGEGGYTNTPKVIEALLAEPA